MWKRAVSSLTLLLFTHIVVVHCKQVGQVSFVSSALSKLKYIRVSGLGVTTGTGSTTRSRNYSRAPYRQFTHLDFTSGEVIPEDSIPPQSHVYRQVHTDWSRPYSIYSILCFSNSLDP